MTHDPLCPHDYMPYEELEQNSCQCDLIASVRSSERDIIRAKIMLMPAHKRVKYEGRCIALVPRSDCIKTIGEE